MPAARAVLEAEARNVAGAAQAGVSVYVFELDGVTPLGQVMYSSLNGSVTLTNPLISDTSGRVQAYVATGQRCVLRVGTSGTPFPAEFEPDPAAFVIGGAGQGLIVNADIAAAAGILASKLAAGGTANRIVGTTDGTTMTLLQIVDAMIASAAAIAVAKLAAGGTANRVVATADGGTVALQQIVAAMIATGTITNNEIATAAAIALSKLAPGSTGVLKSDGTAITAGNTIVTANIATGGQIVKRQLDYTLATDTFNASNVTLNTWTDCCPNQNFTVDDANSMVEIAVRGAMYCGNPTSAGALTSAILVDSTTRYQVNGDLLNGTADLANPLGGGVVKLTGLAAGVHTVKVQIFSNVSLTAAVYLRASSSPNTEFLAIQVSEHKR